LPALGRPTRPTSAISFRRSHTQRSSPGQPGSARRGARLVEDLKAALPRPPSPPLASTARSPALVRSASTASLSSARTRGATGDFDDDGLAGGAAAALAHAVMAALGAEMLPVAEVDEGVEVVGRLPPHVAAAAAGAAVGAAELDELLAPEADRAGAAVAAAQVDLGLVAELHGWLTCKGRVPDPPYPYLQRRVDPPP